MAVLASESDDNELALVDPPLTLAGIFDKSGDTVTRFVSGALLFVQSMLDVRARIRLCVSERQAILPMF